MVIGLIENGSNLVFVFRITVYHSRQFKNQVFGVFGLVELILDVSTLLQGALAEIMEGLVMQVIHVLQTDKGHSEKYGFNTKNMVKNENFSLKIIKKYIYLVALTMLLMFS